MHKRILAIFVALVLLVCICAIPAAATPADEDLPYIELTKFDDSLVMGVIPGAFYVMGDYGYVLDFSLSLAQINAYGYEITYSWSGNRPNVTGVSFGNTTDNSFRNYYVDGTNLGKIRGSFNGTVGSDVGISFNSSGCYVTVHSVRVFLVENFQVELSAFLYGNGTGVTWTPGSSSSVSTTGYGSIEIDNWRNYDMINVSATLGGYGITSVSARLIDNTSDMEFVIPFEMNYINLSDYNGEHENTLLTISCDMRGVDPATAPDSTLIISVSTSVPSGNYGYIQPTSIYGTVLVESPDEYLSWFRLYSVSFGSMEGFLSFLPNINSLIYSLLESFENFSTDIQNFLTSKYDDFKTFWSSSLDEKLDTLRVQIAEIEANKWQYLFTPAFQTFRDRLVEIRDNLAVNAQQQQAVHESAQGMTSAGSSLSDLGAEMDSYTPSLSVDDINFDATSLVPALGMASAGTLASIVTSDPLIASMLLIVATLALVAFVLFGKR